MSENLKPDTFQALKLAYLATYNDPLFDPELYGVFVLVVIPRLKRIPDNPEWFPSGKQATIQHIEKICERAKEEAMEKGVEI